MNEITKSIIKGYNVLDIPVSKAIIKEYREDIVPIYVYDLYDKNGKLIALNRYCIKNGDKQSFKILTKEEELILNPPVVKEELILNPPYVKSKELIIIPSSCVESEKVI